MIVCRMGVASTNEIQHGGAPAMAAVFGSLDALSALEGGLIRSTAAFVKVIVVALEILLKSDKQTICSKAAANMVSIERLSKAANVNS